MAKYIVTLRVEVHYDGQPEGLDPGTFVPRVMDALDSAGGTRVVDVFTSAYLVPTEGDRLTPLPGPVPE